MLVAASRPSPAQEQPQGKKNQAALTSQSDFFIVAYCELLAWNKKKKLTKHSVNFSESLSNDKKKVDESTKKDG